jgi:signal transduction histidine kinase
MADRLQARLAYISEFAGNVSHEFKTPITTLRGTVELLRDDDDLPPAQRARFLDNALIELDRLNRLVGGLLTLARAEAAVPSGRVDLTALARVAAERHRVPLRGEAAPVIGHAEQLAAAVDNLIDNARRHGGAIVTLTAWSADGAVGIDVEDDGAGISAANLPRVFDRFFTTARDRGGTGLGLALVKAVAIAHGGDVTVTSQPGRTTFRLRLPAA